MATFRFETISPAEALAITSADTVVFATGPASTVAALFAYGSNGVIDTITLSLAGRSVIFGAALTGVSAGARIQFPDGSRLLLGGAGSDQLVGRDGTSDGLYGGDGSDELRSLDGGDLLQGNQGNDTLRGGDGNDTFYGGQGNDLINTWEGRNFANGNKGDDAINGGLGSDTLLGGQGNDVIFGSMGSDLLNGNLGDDIISNSQSTSSGAPVRMFGEDGNDKLHAGNFSAFLDGGAGHDTITAGIGSTTVTVFAGEGNDSINLFSNLVSVSGGDGDDTIRVDASIQSVTRGDAGNDTMSGDGTFDGGAGNDLITTGNILSPNHIMGGDGNDTIRDAGGPDTLEGGAGNDSIRGGNDSNILRGGDGDDTLNGRSDADTLFGGAGADVFSFDEGYGFSGLTASSDVILDWSAADRLDFEGVPGTAANYREITAPDRATALADAEALMLKNRLDFVAVQVGSDVIVYANTAGGFAPDQAVVLVGTNLNSISFENII